jgi:hypothetical protein
MTVVAVMELLETKVGVVESFGLVVAAESFEMAVVGGGCDGVARDGGGGCDRVARKMQVVAVELFGSAVAVESFVRVVVVGLEWFESGGGDGGGGFVRKGWW